MRVGLMLVGSGANGNDDSTMSATNFLDDLTVLHCRGQVSENK